MPSNDSRMTEDDIMFQLQLLREEALLEANADGGISQTEPTHQDAAPTEPEKPSLSAAQKEEIFKASKHADILSDWSAY